MAVNLVYEDFNIKVRESDHSISDQVLLSIVKNKAANCKNLVQTFLAQDSFKSKMIAMKLLSLAAVLFVHCMPGK